MDTSVLVAAFRSKRGASWEVFRALREGRWTAIVSNHLMFEYEEIMKRSANELRLTLGDVDELLNAISARAEQWLLSHGWSPILVDPDDEPMVQLAHESGARMILTHNTADLRPATALGIEVLRPRDLLMRLRGQT